MPTRVVVFGSGDCGQLGLGEDEVEVAQPTTLIYFDDKEVCEVAAGGLHNVVRTKEGSVWTWGCNDEQALGHSVPDGQIGCVTIPTAAVQVSAGDSMTAVVTIDGAVWAWGTFRDAEGVLGFSPASLHQASPVCISADLPGKPHFIKVAAGANHVLALTSDHRLYAWGCGAQGQLGRRILARHKTLALRPTNVTPRNMAPIKDIAAGAYHSLALTTDGVLLAWGLNNHGQLGLGHLTPILAPTPISNEGIAMNKNQTLPRFIAIAAGEHHSAALSDSGIVYAWGRADSGQLALTPTNLTSLPSSAIIYHKDPSTLNSNANLTNSNATLMKPAAVTLPRPIDRKLFGDCQVTAIASGSNHLLAITKNNLLFSWGFGDMLQLGNGIEQDEPLPIKVKLSGIPIQADAGGQHSIILLQKS